MCAVLWHSLCLAGSSPTPTYPLILGDIDLGKGVPVPNQGDLAKGVTDHRLTRGKNSGSRRRSKIMRWLLQDKVAKPTCLRKYTHRRLIFCNLVVNCYCYSLLLRRKLFLWCIVGLWARCCINRWLIRRLSRHLIPFPSKSGHSRRSLEIGVKYFISSLLLILLELGWHSSCI